MNLGNKGIADSILHILNNPNEAAGIEALLELVWPKSWFPSTGDSGAKKRLPKARPLPKNTNG